MMLAGLLLLLDGALGLRLLPGLTPHASYPQDWREIERRLYGGKIGALRFSLATAACCALALASAWYGPNDWEPAVAVAAIVGWTIGWFAASLKAIRDTLANDV